MTQQLCSVNRPCVFTQKLTGVGKVKQRHASNTRIQEDHDIRASQDYTLKAYLKHPKQDKLTHSMYTAAVFIAIPKCE